MIITTTALVEGRPVQQYLGLVVGEVIIGANIFRDLFAGIRDIVGGRAGAYENAMRGAREEAIADIEEQARRLGADAIVGSISTTRWSAKRDRC